MTRTAISPRLAIEDALEHGGGVEASAGVRRAIKGSNSNNSCPNSTGWALSTWIARTMPSTSALTSFISFIASRMQSVCPRTTSLSPYRPRTAARPAPASGRTCRPSAPPRDDETGSRRQPERRGQRGTAPPARPATRAAGQAGPVALVRANGHAHACFLHRDLMHPRSPARSDELPHALRARRSTPRRRAGSTAPPQDARESSRSNGSASSPKSPSKEELLLARRQTLGLGSRTSRAAADDGSSSATRIRT